MTVDDLPACGFACATAHVTHVAPHPAGFVTLTARIDGTDRDVAMGPRHAFQSDDDLLDAARAMVGSDWLLVLVDPSACETPLEGAGRMLAVDEVEPAPAIAVAA
jgi:hypothetical protein